METINWRYGSILNDGHICDIESQLSVVFPSDYRVLVAKHNGGRPTPNAVDVPNAREVVLERLLRLEAGAKENVLNATGVLRERGRKDLVPFARDPFGNFFCFRFVGKSADAVVLWEHEEGRSTPICKTFSELLRLLHSPDV